MRYVFAWVILATAIAGCTKTSSIQLADDLVHVVTDTAPICGRSGAQEVAFEQAAVATIKYGYDRFLIIADDTVALNTGSSQFYDTTFKHTAYTQSFVIKMFSGADAQAQNAIDARTVLGPEWQEVVEAGGPTTC